MEQYVLDGIISLTDSYLLYIFLGLFLHPRGIARGCKILPFIILMFAHVISTRYITTISPIKFVMFIALDLVFCWVWFEDKWHKYVLFIGLFYILMFMIESAATTILNLFMPDFDISYEMEANSFQLFAIIMMMRLIMLAVILFIKGIKGRPVHRKQWRGLLLMPVLTVGFVWLIYPRYWAMNDQRINTLLMALAIFLVIQNLFVFAYIAAVQSSTERYLEMKAAYDRQRQYFTTITTIQRAVRKMAHDIRHHFIYLMSALEQEDIPKAKSYLVELDENLDNMVPMNITGHYDVDALLHAKARLADRLGIHIRVEGSLPPDIMVSPIDLSVLLGNSLDNAIEAGSRVDGQKEIVASFGYNAPRLNFTVSNPYTDHIQKKANGYFFSKKAGGGLGVEIMDEVVKKYDGALLTEIDDNQFTLTVMLQTLNVSKQNAQLE